MNFGIDAISFYTARYSLDLDDFAKGRNQDVAKFYEDLGQRKMSIAPPNEDIITMAASAVSELLEDNDVNDIELVIFATETGVDFSKSAATYIHHLFSLPKRCRVIEMKQACYSATCGMQLGISWLRQNLDKKVLLVASDIARYEFNTAAESSQGCGAVAMLLSADPRLVAIEPVSGFCTKEAMDFWRPNYLDCALVDGRLSCDVYMRLAEETWKQYADLTKRNFLDHDRFCYHVPVAKLVERTHARLARINGSKNMTTDQLEYQIGKSLTYNRDVGNCYTASLYLSLLSLLDNAAEDLSGKLIGLYSYGSGSIGEFFSARVVGGYKSWLKPVVYQYMLDSRKDLPFGEYEKMYSYVIPTSTASFELPLWQTGKFRLKEIKNHQRVYEEAV